MLRLLGPGARLCDGLNRREVLRIGGLGAFGAGLSLADLTRGADLRGGPTRRAGRRRPAIRSGGPGRASSCS